MKICEHCRAQYTPKGHSAQRQRFCNKRCWMAWVRAQPFDERFWKLVDKSAGPLACWPWLGRRIEERGGYGIFWLPGRGTAGTHRVAVMLSTGNDPGALEVLHGCDNPPCCNPAHLTVGTHADNMKDMISKGRRNVRGEHNGAAKLTAGQVRIIRDEYAAGRADQAGLAKQFGVDQTLVSQIVRRLVWKHVS